jgi:hypothetical protein
MGGLEIAESAVGRSMTRGAFFNWGHNTNFRIVRTGGFPRGESANSEIGIVSPILFVI